MSWNKVKTLLDKDFSILPVAKNGKVSILENWINESSNDFYQVSYYYSNNLGGNWAINCNKSNIFVLDLDMHKEDENGLISYNKLCSDLGIEKVETLTQVTPSGGIHLIFKSDEELKKVSGTANAFKEYKGIDIRTNNYIVCEPSTIDDKAYVMNDSPILELPEKLKEFILKKDNKIKKDRKNYTKPKQVKQGDRDNQLFSYIYQLYNRTKLDYDEILILSKHFNESVFDKPFSERTIEYKVDKMFQKDRCEFVIMITSENEKIPQIEGDEI